MTSVAAGDATEDDLAGVVATMLNANIRPVVDEGVLVGILSRRDVLRCVARPELTPANVAARRAAKVERRRPRARRRSSPPPRPKRLRRPRRRCRGSVMRHTTVAEVMSKRVVSVGPEDSFTDVARLLYTATISAVPVIGLDGALLGVVSDADLLATAARAGGPEPLTAGPANALGRGPRANVGARTAEELMTAPVETVTPQTGVAEAARKMLELGLRWMPVTDEVARIVGVVSRSDMLAVFLHDDASIRAEVVVDVLERTLLMDPARVEVEVRRGVVTLTGQLDTRADAEPAGGRPSGSRASSA